MSSSTTRLHSRGDRTPHADKRWSQTLPEFLLQAWLWLTSTQHGADMLTNWVSMTTVWQPLL